MYKTKLGEDIEDLFDKKELKLFNANDIINALENRYNKSSVYRKLDQLVTEKSLVKVTENNGITYYERNSGQNHPHFICNICNAIKCLTNTRTIELSTDILAAENYVVINQTRFFGICGACKFLNKA